MRSLCVRRLGSAALLAVALAGCDSRPSAPPLQDGPIYQNSREGFRFVPPEGWKQRARGEVPAGKIASERLLAEYKCMTCTKPASVEISVADVPESVPLHEYVKTHLAVADQLRLTGKPETFEINGAPAVRVVYSMRLGKDEMLRAITAFRRGERVYFFTGIYMASDPKSRKEIQTAIDSVVW